MSTRPEHSPELDRIGHKFFDVEDVVTASKKRPTKLNDQTIEHSNGGTKENGEISNEEIISQIDPEIVEAMDRLMRAEDRLSEVWPELSGELKEKIARAIPELREVVDSLSPEEDPISPYITELERKYNANRSDLEPWENIQDEIEKVIMQFKLMTGRPENIDDLIREHSDTQESDESDNDSSSGNGLATPPQKETEESPEDELPQVISKKGPEKTDDSNNTDDSDDPENGGLNEPKKNETAPEQESTLSIEGLSEGFLDELVKVQILSDRVEELRGKPGQKEHRQEIEGKWDDAAQELLDKAETDADYTLLYYYSRSNSDQIREAYNVLNERGLVGKENSNLINEADYKIAKNLNQIYTNRIEELTEEIRRSEETKNKLLDEVENLSRDAKSTNSEENESEEVGEDDKSTPAEKELMRESQINPEEFIILDPESRRQVQEFCDLAIDRAESVIDRVPESESGPAKKVRHLLGLYSQEVAGENQLLREGIIHFRSMFGQFVNRYRELVWDGSENSQSEQAIKRAVAEIDEVLDRHPQK